VELVEALAKAAELQKINANVILEEYGKNVKQKFSSKFQGSEFISKTKYAKILNDNNLITLCPGATHEGQHVFHIIATANGGPNHSDNFLYALGGSFNSFIGAKHDAFNCVLAGLEKSRLAAAAAYEVANDLTTLGEHIKKSTSGRTFLSTEDSCHYKMYCKYRNNSNDFAEALFNEGKNILRDMYTAHRKMMKISDAWPVHTYVWT
jgi:hypothetical protein